MKWLRMLAAAIPLSLLPAAPVGAIDPQPISPWCLRHITISPVSKAEGTLSAHETGFTWFAFTVQADGCVLTGATVVYRTVPLDTEDDDFIADYGTLTWLGGDMSSRIVYVRVIKDSNLEADEQFVLKVVCEESRRISAGTYARGTIVNDDGPAFGSEPVPYNYHCRQ